MRDGTTLLADFYRPQEAGSYPVILMRMPYPLGAKCSSQNAQHLAAW
ncbi:putative acyl esterase [Skermanella aerolata]